MGVINPGLARLRDSLAAAPPRKVLVLRLGALGDLVFLMPAIVELRRRWPEAEIHWLAKQVYRPLVESLPAVDRCWPFPGGRLNIIRTGLSLRREGFDLVVDFHANLRSGLISWLTGCPRRAGFARPFNKEGNSLFNPARVAPPSLTCHKVDRNLFLTRSLADFEAADIARPELRPDAAAEASVGALLGGVEPVVLHAGASNKGTIKRWFPERYAAVARAITEAGLSPLMLWGDEAERQAAVAIAEQAGGVRVFERRLSFPELCALLRRARAYLGVDSGPAHLANALGAPVIALFGPKDPRVYRPYFPGGEVIALNDDPAVACPPCNATRCRNPAGRLCLEAITAERVSEALLRAARA